MMATISTSTSAMDVTIRQLKNFSVATNTPANAVMSDGTKYYGDIRPHDGAPHGKGYAYLADGSRYGGEWKDGKFHGSGAMITDSYEYEGSWEFGRMHGMGTMLYKDSVFSSVMHGIASVTPFEQRHRPLEYRGEFHRVHHRHGKGTMIYRSGDCYEGDWAANQRDGLGTMRFENGEKYVGFWSKDEMSGTGTMTYNDGSIFTGEMVSDVRNGKGLLKFPNGDTYEGTFECDQMEGEGKMSYRNGDVYKGMWKDGIRHGMGEFSLKRTGATITGNFHKGLIQGKGCICVMPGRIYFKGEYYKGERIRGACWMNDGSCYDGEWVGDNMSGRGLMWYPNGDFYYGQFVRSKRHGKGCLNIAADGTEYAGEWVEDKWCGVGMRKDRDGNISSGTFGVPSADGANDASGNVKINRKAVANASNSVKMLPATRGIPKVSTAVAASPLTAAPPSTPTSVSAPGDIPNGANGAASATAGGSSSGVTSPAAPIVDESAEVFPLLHGYQGEWDGEAFSGIGNIYLPNGDHFIGLFSSGYRHGVGAMERVVEKEASKDKAVVLANQRIPVMTTGRWVRDSLCGNATVRFANDTLYQGQWEDALRHGHGQFRCEDGTVYNGGWYNDVQYGEGCLFLVNKDEPLYAYPAADAASSSSSNAKSTSPLGLLDAVFTTLFSSSNKSAKPAPILLGYEDLCSIHGRWEMDGTGGGAASNSDVGSRRKEKGKLCGQVTIFFANGYEKVYQGEWMGNRQAVYFPHRVSHLRDSARPRRNSNANHLAMLMGVSAADAAMTTNECVNDTVDGQPQRLGTPITATASPYAVTGPTSANAASAVCTFCQSQFGFFKKESFCAGCHRVSCPSCLLDVVPHTVSRTKGLPKASGVGGSGAVAPTAAVGAAGSNTTATAGAADGVASPILAGPSSSATVELCKDCVSCLKDGIVYATQWFTFRKKKTAAHLKTPEEGGSAGSTPTTAGSAASPSAAAVAMSPPPSLIIGAEQSDRRNFNFAPPHSSSSAQSSSPAVTAADTMSPLDTLSSPEGAVRGVIGYQVYKGTFIEGNVPHGQGILWRDEEACYRGDFRQGTRCGQGSLGFSNGEEYFGGWERNLPHGVGVYRCNDGAAIEAEWEMGKVRRLRYQGEVSPKGYERHGTGVAVYSDGTRYNGEWEYNARHGTGLVQYSNGTIYSGQFVHDNQHGLGKIVNADSVFMGEFREGSKHGVGALVVGRKTLKGTWTDDVLGGWVRIWNDDASEIIDTLYKNDEERTDVFMVTTPQEDEAVSMCPGCKSGFGFFLRRHHCRLCGGVFCDACTRARVKMPAYFKVGDLPQRACGRCKTSLDAGSTLAVKRYRDGGVYVGQWSQGRWAGRGLYRSPNGHMANVLSKPPGGEKGQSYSYHTNTGPGLHLHEDLNIIEDLRHNLCNQQPATQTEMDGFAVWWDKIVKGVDQPYAYNFTPYADLPPPSISLPFEINVFTEFTAGSRRARDRAAAEARRARFVPCRMPMIPPAPWHLKPVRPRKVVEPTEDDVMAAIRTERVKGLLNMAPQGIATEHGVLLMTDSTADRDLVEIEASVPRAHSPDHSPVIMDDRIGGSSSSGGAAYVKTVGDLRKVSAAEAGDGATTTTIGHDGLVDSISAMAEGEGVANSSAASSPVGGKVRINFPTPPVPSKDSGGSLALDWPSWDPRPNPVYKGVASAPGGEQLAPRGTINTFLMEGLDSGPLSFEDVPQKFRVNWNTRNGAPPEVFQMDREGPDDMGPEPLAPLAVTVEASAATGSPLLAEGATTSTTAVLPMEEEEHASDAVTAAQSSCQEGIADETAADAPPPQEAHVDCAIAGDGDGEGASTSPAAASSSEECRLTFVHEGQAMSPDAMARPTALAARAAAAEEEEAQQRRSYTATSAHPPIIEGRGSDITSDLAALQSPSPLTTASPASGGGMENVAAVNVASPPYANDDDVAGDGRVPIYAPPSDVAPRQHTFEYTDDDEDEDEDDGKEGNDALPQSAGAVVGASSVSSSSSSSSHAGADDLAPSREASDPAAAAIRSGAHADGHHCNGDGAHDDDGAYMEDPLDGNVYDDSHNASAMADDAPTAAVHAAAAANANDGDGLDEGEGFSEEDELSVPAAMPSTPSPHAAPNVIAAAVPIEPTASFHRTHADSDADDDGHTLSAASADGVALPSHPTADDAQSSVEPYVDDAHGKVALPNADEDEDGDPPSHHHGEVEEEEEAPEGGSATEGLLEIEVRESAALIGQVPTVSDEVDAAIAAAAEEPLLVEDAEEEHEAEDLAVVNGEEAAGVASVADPAVAEDSACEEHPNQKSTDDDEGEPANEDGGGAGVPEEVAETDLPDGANYDDDDEGRAALSPEEDHTEEAPISRTEEEEAHTAGEQIAVADESEESPSEDVSVPIP